MKNIKKLTLGLLLSTGLIMQAEQSQNSRGGRSFGENILLPVSFTTDVAVDAVTLDQTHQTRKLIDGNRSNANQQTNSTRNTSKRSAGYKQKQTYNN